MGLLKWFSGKESTCQAGDMGSIPWLGRSPREGNGYPLQYSCLENSMDRGAWRATVHGVAESWTEHASHAIYAVLGEPWWPHLSVASVPSKLLMGQEWLSFRGEWAIPHTPLPRLGLCTCQPSYPLPHLHLGSFSSEFKTLSTIVPLWDSHTDLPQPLLFANIQQIFIEHTLLWSRWHLLTIWTVTFCVDVSGCEFFEILSTLVCSSRYPQFLERIQVYGMPLIDLFVYLFIYFF